MHVEKVFGTEGLSSLHALCGGAAVVPSQSLLKCLEAALHSSHQELVQALLAEVGGCV